MPVECCACPHYALPKQVGLHIRRGYRSMLTLTWESLSWKSPKLSPLVPDPVSLRTVVPTLFAGTCPLIMAVCDWVAASSTEGCSRDEFKTCCSNGSASLSPCSARNRIAATRYEPSASETVSWGMRE